MELLPRQANSTTVPSALRDDSRPCPSVLPNRTLGLEAGVLPGTAPAGHRERSESAAATRIPSTRGESKLRTRVESRLRIPW